MRSIIPLLGLVVLLGCDGADAPDPATVPSTVGAVDEGLTATGAVFAPAPASKLERTVEAMSSPREGATLAEEQGEGQVFHGVLNPETLRAFQASRSKAWGGAR